MPSGREGGGHLRAVAVFFLFLSLTQCRFGEAREFRLLDPESGQGFLGEVASGDEPFVILLDQQHAGEPDQRVVVGEDADDV